MFRRVSIYLAAPAVLFAGSTFASPALADQQQIAAPSAPDGAAPADQAQKKMVCRSVLQTGTRFATRQCATQTAWNHQEDEARRAARENIDRAVVNTTHGD
jgi:hypothetical protein